MPIKTKPMTMLLVMLAGWINREQHDVIEYLKAENKILRDKIGKKRIILTDRQRIHLATLGKKLGRSVLSEVCCAFSPDTLLRWHRMLVARKYDGSRRRKTGRPGISEELVKAIIKFAKCNPDWGCLRIKGQLNYLGYKVSHETISRVLKKYNVRPNPTRKRKTTWNEFIKHHMDSLAAIDFFSKEVYTLKGLTRYMVLVVIEYSTRKVHIAGIVAQPDGEWMSQTARNLTDIFSGFLKEKKYLVHDRDPLFTRKFKEILESSGIKTVPTTPMSPNLNPFIERFNRSIKHECLNKMLIFGERHLEYVVSEYVSHYNSERAHQGVGNNIIEPPPQGKGKIVCDQRLGGLLKFYKRAA